MRTMSVLALNFGERVAYSGKMLVIGFGTVFLALIVLWGVLELFRRVLEIRRPAEKKEKRASSAPATPVASPAPATAANDDVLVAVLTAAVAAAMAEEGNTQLKDFRVVSFRRIS